MNNDIYEEFEYFELDPIELVGYSKNNIVEVKEKVQNLPHEHKEKLSLAYSLLNEVQEYLYNH